MRKAISLVALIASVGVAVPALAADPTEPGWYAQMRGGAVAVENMNSFNSGANLSIDPRTGWMIQGEAGYRFSSPFRVALQAGYQRNNLRGSYSETGTGVCGGGVPCLGGNVYGHISAPSLFGMVYYDLPLSERLKFSVGGGLGAQRTDMTVRTIGTTGGVSSPYTLIDDGDTVFAQRASAELAYAVGPKTDVTLGYTYTHADTAHLAGQGGFTPFTFADSMASHAVTAGVKLAF